MKKVKITYPIDLSIVDGTDRGLGEKLLSGDGQNNIDIFIKSDPGHLSGEDAILNIRHDLGFVGGEHSLRPRPPSDGLLPKDFSRPHGFFYQIDTNNVRNFIGQSGDSVKEFYPMDFYDGIIQQDTSDYREFRIHAFNEDLLCVNEGFVNGERLVFVWLYDATALRFNLQFTITDQIVDSSSSLDGSQKGSPDLFVFDGMLHLAFRSCDRTNLTNFVNIYRLSKSSGFYNGVLFSSFEMVPKDSNFTYDDFRLRAASGGDNIMIVTSAVYQFERTVDNFDYGIVEVQDMRSYLSFDGGITYNTFNDTVSNITINDANDLSSKFGGISLASMFIPEFVYNGSQLEYIGHSVKFALYYDLTMGSFVILKGGDPPANSYNRAYLIGVKTREDNPLIWEPCLRYFMGFDRDTGVDNTQESSNADFETANNTFNKPIWYEINDIDVAQGDTYNWMSLDFKRQAISDDGALESNRQMGVMQFQFLPSDKKPVGFYDKVLSYGQQSHEEYFFVTTCADMDTTGYLHGGAITTSSDFPVSSSAICCMWRNQYVTTTRIDLGGIDQYRSMAVHRPWSNLGEEYGYESCYTRHTNNYHTIADWSVNDPVGFSYDFSNHVININAAALDSYYLEYGIQSALFSNKGSVITKGVFNNLNTIKCKFQFFIESHGGGEVEFFNLVHTNPNTGIGRSLRLTIDNTGDIRATNYNGSINYGIIGNVDWNSYIEFFISLGFIQDMQIGACVWYRDHTLASPYWSNKSLLWTHMWSSNIGFQSSPSTRLLLGVVDNPVGITEFQLGDIYVSNFATGYKPTLGDNGSNLIRYVEPAANVRSTPAPDPYNTSYSRVFSQDVYLRDGDKLSFKGGQITSRDVESYRLIRSRSLNRRDNVLDYMTSSVFNMIPYYFPSSKIPILLERKDSRRFDTLNLYNLAGVTSVVIRVGDYDVGTDSWASDVSQTISLLSDEINIIDLDDNFIELSSSYEDKCLVGKTIVERDFTGVFIKQYIVKDNFSKVIQLDEPLLLDINSQYFLLKSECSVDLDSSLLFNNGSNIGLFFSTTQGIDDPKLFHVGQVMVGTSKTIDDITVEENLEYQSNEETYTSEFDRIFPSYSDQHFLIKRFNYSTPFFNRLSNDETQYKNMFLSFYMRNIPVGLTHIGDVSGEKNFFGFVVDVSVSPDGYNTNSDFSVVTQIYKEDQ